MAWWHHTATSIWVNIGSGNQIMPTYHPRDPLAFIWEHQIIRVKLIICTWYSVYSVYGTHLYLAFWNSKVHGTYLYLKANVLDSCPKYFCQINKNRLECNSLIQHQNQNYWNGSCVCWQHGVWSLDIKNELRRNPNYDTWDSPKYR